jgi:DNA repair protein RecN (Recombination protein N)
VIFDEIDSGIGGKTANQLGYFIKGLSVNHQILCISHLPQVASYADQHLKIEKISNEEKSLIKFKAIDSNERKEEIARMLSGNITNTALEHAEELLNSSANQRIGKEEF